jgi:hypothetical protein
MSEPWLKDLPAVDDILKRALKELGITNLRDLRKQPPYVIAEQLEKKCHEIYNRYESRIREKRRKGLYGPVDDQKFETSLANSRRARAGKTLEKIFISLLDAYNIKYERDVHINEVEFDFVIPSRMHAINNPRRSILISIKREVRERWKLTVGDAYILRYKYGYPLLENVWFASLGEPPLEAVTAMASLCIRVYIPNSIYEDTKKRASKLLTEGELKRIRPFSYIIEDVLKILEGEEIKECEITTRAITGTY